MEFRPRLNEHENELIKQYRLKNEESRVLIIGDLHEPFCLDGYFEHCLETFQKYQCNRVVFIGDIIDSHYMSYHETDPDGFSGVDELDLAIFKLKKWYAAFPVADWIIGNHDRLVNRKALSGGISKRWIRDLNQVLEVYKWQMHTSLTIDNVQYLHGEGGEAVKKAASDFMSTVQGHLHTKMYTQYLVGKNFKIFGMQVGCGVDWKSYGMDYAKNHKKPAIGCGVVIGGKLAINVPMEL
jgi:metallophosphoesterase superfamily enzyme